MHTRIPFVASLVLGLSSFGLVAAERSSSAEEANLYFISPAHGETVPGNVLVRFGLSGMGIAPAGVERSNTGHHHLLIDMDELPASDEPMPASEKLVHFGKGQTQARIKLAPGKHTLQLVLGNHNHVMHKPIVKSQKITITVSPEPEEVKEDKGSGLPGLFR
ncbi:MAG: DUF4399 domain-containing protein [Oceanococcus sp.]